MRSRGHLFGTVACDCSELWICHLHGGPRMLIDLETKAQIHDPLGWDTKEVVLPPSDEEVWDYYIDMWRERIADHYDNAIVITGNPGRGKSTLALKIALDITEGRLSLERDVLYSLDDLLDRLEHSAPGDIIVVDEAILVAQATGGGNKEVYILERALALSRELGVSLVLNIPYIGSLAKGLRERRVEYWLHVEDRGIATVHEQSSALTYRLNNELLPFIKVAAPYTHLMWQPFPSKDPMWKEYSRLKHERTLREIHRALTEVRGTQEGGSPARSIAHTRKRKREWMRNKRAEKRAESVDSSTRPRRPRGGR